MRVTLATCRELPEPDVDEPLLLGALRTRGVDAATMAWDDEGANFGAAEACVIRSTWNYFSDVERFLAWAARTAGVTRLWNPLSVVQWNAHKGYLRELAGRGIPVVPTRFIGRGAGGGLEAAMDALGVDRVVVKPAVSAGSFATLKVSRGDLERGEAHVREVAARCDVMVQPYVESVEGYGERSLVWIDGELTHAIRKSPRFGGDDERVSGAQPIAPEERALAEKAVAAVPSRLLYARVDMARDADGAPMLMELELIEPSLFLRQSPAALDRLADAIAARALPLFCMPASP
jgi:glutathione synthase/RimK-type ligase-like ATP-grasp enzyme